MNFAVILWLEKCEKEKEMQVWEVSAIVCLSLSLCLFLSLFAFTHQVRNSQMSAMWESSQAGQRKIWTEISSDSIKLHVQK